MAEESRDQPQLTAKSRGGRPRVNEPKGSAVSTWLCKSEHDRLAQLAIRRETSISSLVRSLLLSQLR